MCEITVGVDEAGVWCEHRTGTHSHISWGEVSCIAAVRIDCTTHVETILELGHESGHILELNESSSGFDSVVDAISSKYSLATDWFTALGSVKPRDPAILIWKRCSTN